MPIRFIRYPVTSRRADSTTIILERFGYWLQPAADLSEWDDVVRREFSQRKGTVRVGMVGKYVDLVDAYKSLNEALDHAGLQTDTRVEIRLHRCRGD